MIKDIVSIVLIFVFSNTLCAAQSELKLKNTKQDSSNVKMLQLTPLQYILKHMVIIYQNEYCLILTDKKNIDRYYEALQKKGLLENIKEVASEYRGVHNDTLNLFAIYKKRELDHVIINYAGFLIKEQECIIISKDGSRLFKEVDIKPYKAVGCSGNVYYINKKILFKTIEKVY